MARPRGRPRELYGPMINIKFSALTHAHIVATAKVRGQSVSQVIRDCLAEVMGREWGQPGREEQPCNEVV